MYLELIYCLPYHVYAYYKSKHCVLFIADGCFENVTVDLSDSEEVLAEEKVTCQERCRARDFSHAAIFNTTCICLNTSQVDGTRTDKSYCDSSETPQFIRIHDLGMCKLYV